MSITTDYNFLVALSRTLTDDDVLWDMVSGRFEKKCIGELDWR